MSTKRNRSSNPLPTDILSSLESSDKRAAKLRKSQISTETLPRSFAAKSQVDIQTSLMECRILVQRALTALPQVSDDEESRPDTDKAETIGDGIDELMSKLVNARRTLFPSLLENNGTSSETDSDSDSDKNNVEDKLEQEYSKLRTGWKDTLNKHHANTHLQNQQNKNKFQIVDQSFWTQIENNVKHSAILEHTHLDSDNGENGQTLGFDDSKLYQHMLQDYITLSAERGKDNAATAAAERMKRSMKKKTKKDIDWRASKGRKIRYVVHEKLQNFTFPVSRFASSMGEDVLFKSMLGGVSGRR
jgi:hypothetical protein